MGDHGSDGGASAEKAEKHDSNGASQFDVVILGSGLAGSVLAACLAAGGASVAVVDAGTHPRFAIGESTIPYTSMMMRLVAERYGVPEIKWLTTFESVQAKITTQCGVKRNFGFLYHRPGQPQNPAEVHQFPIPKITHTENHFFRQDIDAWMLTVAAKYGAAVRQQTRVTDVQIGEDGVVVETANGGAPIRAKFIVDASGFRSVLADKFQLRETPSRLRAHSRSLFTHMIGVAPYEKVSRHNHHNPSPWSQGTLHHLFPGGWMWVIPFDNHPRATNPLCSIGISYDPRQHPIPEDLTPQQEFDAFLEKFPDVALQFKEARPVRDWVRTGRLQYSSTQTVGYRWCLTSHAAGFVDALFSRGLSNTMEIVNALTWRLLDAIKDDDFSVERFSFMQELEQGMLDFNDDLVANAYTSFTDYRLWDAWFRVWSLGQFLATFEINRAYAKFLDTRDPSVLQDWESHWWWVSAKTIPEEGAHPEVRRVLKEVSVLTQAVQEDGADPLEAAERILATLRATQIVPPAWGFADPDNKWTDANLFEIVKALRWSRREAPADLGPLVHDGLTLFMKKRFARGEFAPREELKHLVAGWPLIGRRLRVPAPK